MGNYSGTDVLVGCVSHICMKEKIKTLLMALGLLAIIFGLALLISPVANITRF